MIGLIKKIFKKDESHGALAAPAASSAPTYASTATPGASSRPPSNPFSNAALGAMPPADGGHTTVRQRSGAAVEKIPTRVTLPLDEIVPGLTHEFQSLFQTNSDAEVSFPLQVILPQLSTGRIRVAFGDLRNACPEGTCVAGPEHDAKLVELPLAKVLSRVNSTCLPRKTQRPAMNVPDDVTGLFGHHGEAIPSLEASSNPAPASRAVQKAEEDEPAVPIAIPRPSGERKQAVNPGDLGDIPSPFNFTAPAADAAPAAPEPIRMKMAEPPSPPPRAPKPEPAPEAPAPIQFNPAAPVQPPTSKPAKPPVVGDARKPVAGKPSAPPVIPRPPIAHPEVSKPSGAARPSAPRPSSVAGLDKKNDDNFICLPLADAQAEWPEAVQAEIQANNLEGADLALPYGEVDLAMRKGKIVFSWKVIRSWIVPTEGVQGGSEHDEEQLVLPLKLVAPLFLKQRPTTAKKRQVSVEEEEIPDLFSGGPGEEAPAATAPAPKPVAPPPSVPTPTAKVPAPPKPQSAPEPAAPVAPSAPKAAARPTPVASEMSVGNPVELMKQTVELPGVTGALLAMSDGLLVAAELPAPLSGDTVAAFLPQIFGRLTQFSTELKLGDLTSVMLVMDNSPWIIFRTGKIFFAVVGKSGEALPLPKLTAIVAELKRQN